MHVACCETRQHALCANLFISMVCAVTSMSAHVHVMFKFSFVHHQVGSLH